MGEIILPKRYYTFKHFTNLIKKGYSLIQSNISSDNQIYTGAFISEDNTKIILQVFNEGEEKDFSMDIPLGAISVERILTTNNDSEEFTSLGTQEINYYDRYFITTLPELSLTSFVFNIDESLSNGDFNQINENEFKVRLYPNPSHGRINLIFPKHSNYRVQLFDLKGTKITGIDINDSIEYTLDISSFAKGTYLIKINSLNNFKEVIHKIIKE